MTTYGTIPTDPSASSKPRLVSRAKERIQAGLGMRRPWNHMIHFRALTLPDSFSDAFFRIKTNLSYFRVNYVIVSLLILFLSLLWHPISLIVFVVMMAAWLFLYFLRDEPVSIFGRMIDDRVVLVILSVLTLFFLFLTKATVNILVAILVGVLLVLVHAVSRRTDDLYDDDGAGIAGVMRDDEGMARLPLKDAASASFSKA